MNTELKLLLLEDNPADAELLTTLLSRAGLSFTAAVATNEAEFHNALKCSRYHAVLADNALPQYSSLEALKIIKETNPSVAFILVTGTVSEEFAVDIIQQGADDYILKTNLTRLPAAITNAVNKKRIEWEKQQIEKEKETEKEFSLSIINSLPGIFYLCDDNGRFLQWNKNFETIAGYTAEEIKEMSLKYFFVESKQGEVADYIEKTLLHGHGETETIFLTKDSKKIPYYFTSRSVTYENNKCLICIGVDMSINKESEKELKELNTKLRKVSAHLEKIKEKEQARIAREVHDQLGQQLTGLKMDLTWIQKISEADKTADKLRAKVKEMSLNLEEAIQTVRKVAADLRPSLLDDFGLVEALRWHGMEFSKRSGIKVHFSPHIGDLSIHSDISIGLYRLYQEALTNVARHANAKNVHTRIEYSNKQITMIIRDDGRGFDVTQITNSLGLLGMKERVYIIGGTLTIDSEIGNGTTLLIVIPIVLNEITSPN